MGCGASSNATPANEPPVAHITDPTAHHIQMEGDKRNIPFQSIAIWVKHAEELPDAVVQQWKGNQDVSLHCEVTGDTANGGVKGINVLEIGYHKLRAHRVQSDPANPEWNRRFQVCFEEHRGTAVTLRLLQGPDAVVTVQDVAAEVACPMPKADDPWADHVLPVGEQGRLHIALKALRGPYCTLGSLQSIGFEEHEVAAPDGNPERRSSLWHKCGAGNTKAVFWLAGRGDTFMHPHVAQKLLAHGYDVFSYDPPGCGRSARFLKAKLRTGHPFGASFEAYGPGIDAAVAFAKGGRAYAQFVAYAHGAGALVLAEYLRCRTDAAFTGFVLNAPALDAAHVAGLARVPADGLPAGPPPDPDAVVREGALQVDVAELRLYSMFRFEPEARPLFFVPHATAGFVAAATDALAALRKSGEGVGPLSQKPGLLLAALGDDDALEGDEAAARAKWFTPNLTAHVMPHGSRDVLLSYEKELYEEALRRMMVWLDALTSLEMSSFSSEV